MELPVTYGIEVEFEDGDRAAISADLRRAHLFGWRIKADASCGHELVTPILGDLEGFEKLSTALDILKKHGARVTNRCGLHVHYGMQGFTFDQVRRVLSFFVRHEDTMFLLVDHSRRDNRYCSRVDFVDDVIKRGSDAWADTFRHSWINGQAHRRHNTVELRLLQGTLEIDTIRGWTLLGMSMVVAAKAKRVRVKKDYSLTLTSLLVTCGCYRLRGKDPEHYQVIAKEWAHSVFDKSVVYVDLDQMVADQQRRELEVRNREMMERLAREMEESTVREAVAAIDRAPASNGELDLIPDWVSEAEQTNSSTSTYDVRFTFSTATGTGTTSWTLPMTWRDNTGEVALPAVSSALGE